MAKSQVARPLTLLRHSSSLHSTGSMLLMFRWPLSHAPSHGTLRASFLAYTTSVFSSDYTHRPTFPLSAHTQSYTPTSAACPDGRSQIVHVLTHQNVGDQTASKTLLLSEFRNNVLISM
ncbi:hypothetical protein CPC08DRAFT_401531 [Agrocybe pediades]|nr:hypothetical protein CPC08DRAFT_401531 [Agrocybe pediades]